MVTTLTYQDDIEDISPQYRKVVYYLMNQKYRTKSLLISINVNYKDIIVCCDCIWKIVHFLFSRLSYSCLAPN